MKVCAGCGEELDDYVRFHWTGPESGHYADEEAEPTAGLEDPVELDESWTANVRRAAVFFGRGPLRAPPPGPRPPAPWGREDDLRRGCVGFLRDLGFAVYDLEQGFRSDGSTRVGEGIGDIYFHGHGLRGWVECKRWNNEPSKKQVAFGLEELGAGGCYLVIYELGQLVEWTHDRRRSS